MNENYYDILGVSRNADSNELKAAYRRQAQRWHPDKNLGNKEAEDRFKKIAQAYHVLSNLARRIEYDTALNSGRLEFERISPEIDPSMAAAMFFHEMESVAIELTLQNVRCSYIATELINRGCPETVAQKIALSMENYRKDSVRKMARKVIFQTLVITALGIIAIFISVIDISELFSQLLVKIGLILICLGSLNLTRALYFFVSGRVPGQTGENPTAPPTKWRCPKCNEYNVGTVFKCANCGFRLI